MKKNHRHLIGRILEKLCDDLCFFLLARKREKEFRVFSFAFESHGKFSRKLNSKKFNADFFCFSTHQF